MKLSKAFDISEMSEVIIFLSIACNIISLIKMFKVSVYWRFLFPLWCDGRRSNGLNKNHKLIWWKNFYVRLKTIKWIVIQKNVKIPQKRIQWSYFCTTFHNAQVLLFSVWHFKKMVNLACLWKKKCFRLIGAYMSSEHYARKVFVNSKLINIGVLYYLILLMVSLSRVPPIRTYNSHIIVIEYM